MGFAIGEEDSEFVEKHKVQGSLHFGHFRKFRKVPFLKISEISAILQSIKNIVGNLKSVAKTMDLRFLSKSGGRWISVEILENPL